MNKIEKKPIEILSTIILTIAIFVVPVIIIPGTNYNYFKMVILYCCGVGLAITFLFATHNLKIHLEDYFLVGFGIMVAVSTIFSVNIEKSIWGEWQRYEGLIAFVTYFLIYFSAKNYFIRYKNFEKVATIVYTGICAFAVLQYFMAKSIELSPLFGKGANGTFGNVNFFGSFVSLILPLFIFQYLQTGNKKYIISSAIGSAALIACVTRSAWVAFACFYFVLFLYVMQKNKKEYRKKFGILSLVIFLTFSFMFITQGKNSVVSNKFDAIGDETERFINYGLVNSIGSGRISIWKWCSRVVIKSPIIGCGVDALSTGLAKYFEEEYSKFVDRNNVYIDKAHNEYLQIGATMGLPALIFYLGFICTIIAKLLKKIETDATIMMLLIVLISYIVQAFFNFSTIGVAPILWFILGMASKQVNEQKEAKEN